MGAARLLFGASGWLYPGDTATGQMGHIIGKVVATVAHHQINYSSRSFKYTRRDSTGPLLGPNYPE